ncbi:glycosyltransferase [candidate division WWE3 bacterium]|nr:glycosyltransferase [candidate division WWE3 bacterium]
MEIKALNHSSLIKLFLFILAILADIQYGLFLLNPNHWGNTYYFLLNAVADVIMLCIFTLTWGTVLYFELFKYRYYQEIETLSTNGRKLAKVKTAILIPIVNEELGIIKQTIAAVKKIHGSFEVHLLDDGQRNELKRLAENEDIYYHRRNVRDFFKAGNLNFGISKVKTEFIAVFDADYLPHPEFLSSTLPLFSDLTVGAVQTPQGYYNEDTIFARGMKYIENLFYRYIMPAKHMLGSSFIVGTNVVYRASALRQVGGITNINHSEDLFTSLSLAENGYRVFYLDKQLAVGLAPTTLISFFNQQFRWALGGFTMLFSRNPLRDNRLNFDQKIQYAFSNLFYLSGIAVAIYLFSPLIGIFLNIKAIDPEFFSQWLSVYALYFVTNLGFFIILIEKNRIETMMLGLISFVPYVTALLAAVLQSSFHWKETNFITREIIAQRIVPLLFYVVAAVSVLSLTFMGYLTARVETAWYIGWMAINVLIISVVLIDSYRYTYVRNKML